MTPVTAVRPIALLDPQTHAHPVPSGPPWAEAVEVVDLYDLDRVDLSAYAGVVVEAMVDQEFLHRRRRQVRSFLDGGGTVVWSGQLFRPWLPGCGAFVAKEIRSVTDFHVHVVRPHPVFAGVEPADLTFRRGVAGFFARGHHPPPAGAEVLLALAGGEPVVYVERPSTGGTVFAHAGTGLLDWAEPASTASRIAPQLVAWIMENDER